MFKDGDEVGVDTGKGIVKKWKRHYFLLMNFISHRRLVQRGLARYNVREKYENAFAFNPNSVEVERSVLTKSGGKLLSSKSTPLKLDLSALHPVDGAIVQDYLQKIHSYALNSRNLRSGERISKKFRGYRLITTPFGRFFYKRPSEKQESIGALDVRIERTNDLAVLELVKAKSFPQPFTRTALEFEKPASKERLLLAYLTQEIEKQHADISSKNSGFHFEHNLVTEAISLLSQRLHYKHSNVIHRQWVEQTAATLFNKYKNLLDAGGKINDYTALLHSLLNFSTKLNNVQKKKLATILADPHIKTIKAAHALLKYVKKNNSLVELP